MSVPKHLRPLRLNRREWMAIASAVREASERSSFSALTRMREAFGPKETVSA